MPTPPRKTAPSKAAPKPAAADAAIVEATEVKTITFEFQGEEYTFKPKRLNSVQYRLLMQKGQDAAAFEWLLGAQQFRTFLASTSDEDGCTHLEAWVEFVRALGEAVGVGNS